MKKEESREIWNVLNARKNALLDEVRQTESVMGMIEKRENFQPGIKLEL